MNGSFIVERLGAQDRSSFACGVAALDLYLQRQASQDVRRLMTSCFVLIEKETLEVVGFYTLAATSVAANDLPAETIKRLPRYPTIPAALLGRLAVISRFHGKGLGGALLADAALRVLRSDTRAFALIVDAKDDAALAFYLRHGFLSLASRRMSMFLPVATILKGAAAG